MNEFKRIAGSSNNSPLGDGGIAVIADDFTGAAELAGISLRFGLTVELCVDEVEYKNADVLVISTDSRSLNKEAALLKTGSILKKVLQLQPSFVYKKIDSVLRGYVVDEVKLQMQLMERQKAIIMPANPTLGRTIRKGEYFIDNIRIDETAFVNDPEFPINTSFVKKILKNEAEVVKKNEGLPAEGMVIGEAEDPNDYKEWIGKFDKSWVLAGAGDFFTALLSKKYVPVKLSDPKLQRPFLYVCGTAFNDRKAAVKKIQEKKQCVCYLENENDEEVVKKGMEIIKSKDQLILAFDDETDFLVTAAELRIRMAVITKQLIEKTAIKELFIEGGSTAAAILQELGIKMLEPVNELSRGVVRMRSGNLFITVKPGSYKLPDTIRNIYFTN